MAVFLFKSSGQMMISVKIKSLLDIGPCVFCKGAELAVNSNKKKKESVKMP